LDLTTPLGRGFIVPTHPIDDGRHRHHQARAPARGGASVKALDRDYLDLTKPINRGILAFLSALAEDERHGILKRANDGRTIAKAKGTRFGRKPKLTAHQLAEALKCLAAGESCRSIARTMAVHHATVARLAG